MLLRRLHFKEHKSIIAIGAADFSMECGRLFWQDQGQAAAFIHKLCDVDVLYIDDLDKAKFTERTEAEVYHVVNSRTEHGKPILATVNLKGDALKDMMSESRGWPIVRRLRDYCKAVEFRSVTR